MVKSIARWLAPAAAVLLMGATPGGAAQAGERAAIEQAQAALSSLDEHRLFNDQAYAESILKHLDAVEPAVPEDVLKQVRQLRVGALIGAGRAAEAVRLSETLIASAPAAAGSYSGAFLGNLSENKPAEAVAAVERATRSVTDPQGVEHLRALFHPEAIWHLFRSLLQEKDRGTRGRLAEALTRIDWPGPDDLDSRDHVRVMALESMIGRGDRVGAATLAEQIESPRWVLRTLAEKRYDGVVPASADREARLAEAVRRWDDVTAERVRQDPGDLDRLFVRVQHLRLTGRYDEAVRLVDPLIADMDAVHRSDTKALWIVNDAAAALFDAGRADEGAALLERLLEVPVEDKGDLVNMGINYATLLYEAGRYEQALARAERIWADYADHTSDYGKMWIAAAGACSLAALDRAAEAEVWLKRIEPIAKENAEAAVDARLCVGDMDGAEAAMLSWLGGDDQSFALADVQRYQLGPQRPPFVAGVDQRREALLARPAVATAIDRVARRLSIPMARE